MQEVVDVRIEQLPQVIEFLPGPKEIPWKKHKICTNSLLILKSFLASSKWYFLSTGNRELFAWVVHNIITEYHVNFIHFYSTIFFCQNS